MVQLAKMVSCREYFKKVFAVFCYQDLSLKIDNNNILLNEQL